MLFLKLAGDVGHDEAEDTGAVIRRLPPNIALAIDGMTGNNQNVIDIDLREHIVRILDRLAAQVGVVVIGEYIRRNDDVLRDFFKIRGLLGLLLLLSLLSLNTCSFLGGQTLGLNACSLLGSKAFGFDACSFLGGQALGFDACSLLDSKAFGLGACSLLGGQALGFDACSLLGSKALGLNARSFLGGQTLGLGAGSLLGSKALGFDARSLLGSDALGLDAGSLFGGKALGLGARGFFSGDALLLGPGGFLVKAAVHEAILGEHGFNLLDRLGQRNGREHHRHGHFRVDGVVELNHAVFQLAEQILTEHFARLVVEHHLRHGKRLNLLLGKQAHIQPVYGFSRRGDHRLNGQQHARAVAHGQFYLGHHLLIHRLLGKNAYRRERKTCAEDRSRQPAGDSSHIVYPPFFR